MNPDDKASPPDLIEALDPSAYDIQTQACPNYLIICSKKTAKMAAFLMSFPAFR